MIWILNSVAQKQGLNWLVTSLLYRGLFVSWERWGEGKKKACGRLPSSTARIQFFDYCYFYRNTKQGPLRGRELIYPMWFEQAASLCINWQFVCYYWQDSQDIQLEEERDKLLTKRAVLIQKVVRGFLFRKRFVKMRSGSIMIQKTWRGFCERRNYRRVSNVSKVSFLKKKMFCVASLRLSLRRTALKTAISWSVSVKCLPSRW